MRLVLVDLSILAFSTPYFIDEWPDEPDPPEQAEPRGRDLPAEPVDPPTETREAST
jgi:hypothetical protein